MITNPTTMAARMKLARLNLGRFQDVKLHHNETRAENARHNTDAARVLVQLMADNRTLREIKRCHSAARAEHYRLTMPTVEKNLRLIPLGREFEHSEAMNKLADQHNKLVEQFLSEYDGELAEAPNRLNGLFEEHMWPSRAQAADSFLFRTQYLPTPTQGAWGEWLVESASYAEDDIRVRLTEALERVRDRCRSDGALFATVFDNIRELVDLVPDLDMTEKFSPIVTVMGTLSKTHSEFISGDDDAREAAARRADGILSMLGGIK
jgi:hypothetical protein